MGHADAGAAVCVGGFAAVAGFVRGLPFLALAASFLRFRYAFRRRRLMTLLYCWLTVRSFCCARMYADSKIALQVNSLCAGHLPAVG